MIFQNQPKDLRSRCVRIRSKWRKYPMFFVSWRPYLISTYIPEESLNCNSARYHVCCGNFFLDSQWWFLYSPSSIKQCLITSPHLSPFHHGGTEDTEKSFCLSGDTDKQKESALSGQYPARRKALHVLEVPPFPVGDAIFSMPVSPGIEKAELLSVLCVSAVSYKS